MISGIVTERLSSIHGIEFIALNMGDCYDYAL